MDTPVCIASAAPFSSADLVAMLVFMIDLVAGPVSLVVLATCAVARTGWRRFIAVIAWLNLTLASVAIATDDGGLGSFVALVWVQAAVAVVVVAVGTRRRWREMLFGADRGRDRPRGHA